MTPVAFGNRLIGPGQPCYTIAEVGINHNGDIELAAKTIAAAAKTGADAVKFQNYHTENFISDRSATYSYTSQGKPVTETQWDMFKRCELSDENLAFLKQVCDHEKVDFISTPTDEAGIDILKKLNSPVLKNGSDYLGNLRLISAMARSGLPTILSTGMATLGDIDEAVRTYKSAGGQGLVLLHCVSSYPAPVPSLNLRKIPALAAAFQVPIGFSDHAEGMIPAITSVTLGACLIEKHFTLDKNLPGPDHHFSSDPAEFAELVAAVRVAELSLGTSAIGPSAAELENRTNCRLSCVAASDITAGTIITEAEITFKRPGTGVPPGLAHYLIGKTARKDIPANRLLSLEDVQT